MQVHLVDGTYELFRQYYGQGRAPSASERAAARGVVASVLAMLEEGATHVGVATDHVIESFRNELWPGYKTGELVPADLRSQFDLVEDALKALGVVVWPMVELEADDALASAAAVASADPRVERVFICTPDKDLGQCVVGDRVVQLDRRRNVVIDEEGVIAKFGVGPASIADWLALVGDAADGFPGVKGWGQRSAAAVLARYGQLESIPDAVGDWDAGLRKAVRGSDRLAAELAASRRLADLFKVLATLRVEPGLLATVDALAWRGPGEAFGEVARALGAPNLAGRAERLAARRA
jgi:5'-3' exonuclease